MPLQLLNVTINSINIATAVIFEEMKNINNYYQKLKNKAKQKAQHPPKTESASTGEKGPGAQTGLQTPGGVGRGLPTPTPREGVRSQGSGQVLAEDFRLPGCKLGLRNGSGCYERKPRGARVLTH